MNKQSILNAVIKDLRAELELIERAALDAKENATSEESKADSEYDTHGIELSYLAGAQAKRAQDLVETIKHLQALELKEFSAGDAVAETALVELEGEGGDKRWYFVLPEHGGSHLEFEGNTIHTISTAAPIAEELLEKKVGDSIEVTVKGQTHGYQILSLY